MYYLSVLSILKNETMNLKLWLDHYIWQGVEHFFLIDNGSTDDPLSILQEYIDNGLVTYYYGPDKHYQEPYYRYMYDREDIKNKTYWLAICDLDEFIFGVDRKLTIKLKTLEAFKIIYCNWFMFGSEGLISHPPDMRTANLHREPNVQHYTKYIFKTSALEHTSQITCHGLANFNDIKRIRFANQLIRLYHYPIQSLEFFEKVKMKRGDAVRECNDNVRDMTYFEKYNKDTTLYDDTLKNLIENTPENYYDE